MSAAPRIENESEDLFAEEREHSDHEDDSELSAAAALTSLVSMRPFTAVLREADGENDDQDEEEVSDKELNIPQRYTKSGRKRAVSFPLKVGWFKPCYTVWAHARVECLTRVCLFV